MSIFDRVATAVTQKAVADIRASTPSKVQKHLPLARKLLFGGVDDFVNAGLDSLLERFGVIGGAGTRLPGQSKALREPTALLGGITLKQARQIFEAHVGLDLAKKNLWCLRITNLSGDMAVDFNMFATDVGYPGFMVTGDAVPVGTGAFDVVTGSERIEMRVATLDDAAGSIKRWFYGLHDRMCLPDGTVGLPGDYLFRVDVMHAFIDERAYGADEALWDTFIMRPGSIEIEKSRRDDAMEELQMTFVEFDTFNALT
jgi:hypothetical protein